MFLQTRCFRVYDSTSQAIGLVEWMIRLALALFFVAVVHVPPLSQAQKKATLPNRFPEPRFEHIGLKDGLPENSVKCILQDRFGFLWLGTQNGLVKYDGYSMVVYQQDPGNPKSIADNNIVAIHEDRAGTLWVGTYFGGLNKFDRSSESFTRYLNNPLDSSSIGSNQVNCIYEDNADRLWVGTTNGLSLLDRRTNKFTRYYSQDWLYGPEVYEYALGLEKTGTQIGSIVKVGNNVNTSRSLTFRQKTEVLLVVMGEGVADYGWLESEHGTVIARSDSNKTWSAGGRPDNRLLMTVLTLNAGRYRMCYKSDESHSYNNWLGNPPSHPEFWGIQVFDISGEAEKVRQMLDALQPINLTRRVDAVVEDQQTGNLLVGGTGGLWTFDVNRKVLSKHDLPDNDPIISQAFIRAFHRGKDGTLWIASTFGLSRYDSRTNSCKSYQVIPSLKYVRDNNFGSLLEDPTGLIWVGRISVPGLKAFDPQTEQFWHYEHNPSDPLSLSFSDAVLSIYEGRSGFLWVGTWGGSGGLDKWDRKRKRFNTVDIDPGHVADVTYSIYEDHAGRILAGTNEGLVQLDGGRKGPIKYPRSWGKGHGLNRITGIIDDPMERGVLWISSSDSGLIKFDSEKNLSSRYRTDQIEEIFIDHEGVLWVGSEVGLNRFDRVTGKFRVFRHDPNDSTSLSQNQIRCIYEDRSGTLWIGTNLGGLNRFDRKTEKFESWKSLVTGREFTSTISIHEDRQGNFWVGEYMTGLHLFDRDKGRSIRNFTERDGLPSNTASSIFEDDSGHLWIATSNGLSRFDPRTRRFKTYWVEDGLPDNFLLVRGLKTRDGRIILGGNKGVTVFHPDSIKDDPVAPQVVISNVSLFNRPDEKLALDGYIPELKEIGLSHSQNDLRFDFVGLQFSEPARNRYKFILENFDRDWVDAGTQRNATYTNLDPGEYTFKVKAANRDGIWNEQGASIRIVITPPWWKTVWAYGSYGVLVIMGLYSLRRYEKNRDRVKQQTELDRLESEKRLQQEFSKQLIDTQEAERKRVASELHDSLGQHLLIVNNELQLYQQGKGQNDPDIQRTTSIVRDAIKEVREISSNLHPHHLEKLGLRPAVEAMIEQVSRSSSVKFDVAITDVADKLSMQAKINLYRVLQEAIANIVRHSGATRAKITISQADKAVHTIIEDNGRGFASGASQVGRQGFGLKSMTERIILINGTIEINSTSGKGTAIQITIPVHS